MWLWISLTVAIVFLYIADKESIVTLVIYALTASLLIFGYINIKRGLNYSDPEKSDSTEFTFAVDANNLLGLVEWDLKKFSDFIDELEKDDMPTHLFFDYGIKKTLKKCLVCEKIPINRIQNFKIMDTKYKCDSCKKARSLVLELIKKASKKIDKTKMEKCNKCLKKHSKKTKCVLKDYVKLYVKLKVSDI